MSWSGWMKQANAKARLLLLILCARYVLNVNVDVHPIINGIDCLRCLISLSIFMSDLCSLSVSDVFFSLLCFLWHPAAVTSSEKKELEKVFYSLPEVCIARTAAVSGVTLMYGMILVCRQSNRQPTQRKAFQEFCLKSQPLLFIDSLQVP